MQFSSRNLYTFIIYKLEFFCGSNCMCKCTAIINRCNVFWCNWNDFICNKFATIVQTNAEIICIWRRVHDVIFIRNQFCITDICFMFLVEGDCNIMILAHVLFLNKRGLHNISVIFL